MGNWHCIPESCARVVYREYLPPTIRYNDRGRGWVYVDGDRYELDNQQGKSSNLYHAFGTYISKNEVSNRDYPKCDRTAYWRSSIALQGDLVLDWNPVEEERAIIKILLKEKDRYNRHKHISVGIISKTRYDNRYMRDSFGANSINWLSDYSCSNNIAQVYGHSYRLTNVVRVDKEPDVCTLTIYLGEEIVWQADYPECPEVEQLPCRLSDEVKEIKIEKIRFLERLEVVPYAYDVRYGALNDSDNYGFLLVKKQIPDGCLNIYRNNIASTIPNNFFQVANTPENGYDLIEQICSQSGCPSPEYQVICDCDCRECPNGTCAVLCGDHICCYDTTTGLSVESIAKNEYCGEVN